MINKKGNYADLGNDINADILTTQTDLIMEKGKERIFWGKSNI